MMAYEKAESAVERFVGARETPQKAFPCTASFASTRSRGTKKMGGGVSASGLGRTNTTR